MRTLLEGLGYLVLGLVLLIAGGAGMGWFRSQPPACPPPAAYPTAAEVTVALVRACPKGSIKITLENGKLEGSCLTR